MFPLQGLSSESASDSESRVKASQFAFRKFHLGTGLLGVGVMRAGCMMIDGRCCDRGNFPIAVRIGDGTAESLLVVVNARSGLVPLFHLSE